MSKAILKELELNPILEQVEPEDFEEKSMAEEILEDMDAPIEDVYTDESYLLYRTKRKAICHYQIERLL